MADEIIRRLTITANSQGVDQTTTSLKNMSKATGDLTVVTDTSSKRSLAAESAYQRQTQALDPAAKAQVELSKATRATNEALAQGLITAAEYAVRVNAISDKLSDQRASSDNASEGIRLTGDRALSAASHLKTAAEAAYALSPAFRGMVNASIVPALKGVSTGLEAIGGAAILGLNKVGTGFRIAGDAVSALDPKLAAVGGTLKSTGTALEAFAPSIGGMVASAASRVLAFISPLAKIYAAIKLVEFAWTSASEQIDKYNKLSQDATANNVTTDYLQRLGDGFVKVGGKIEDALELLKKFNEASGDKLGGSAIQKKIDELSGYGNFQGNSGVKLFKDAADPQAKLEAINTLFKEAVAKGERLAGLDLTATFLSPAAQEQLKKNSNYLDDILKTARSIESTKMAKQEDVDIAASLAQRYDAAAKILGERMIPFQTLLTSLGTAMHMVWVGFVELLATVATKVTNIINGTVEFFQIAWRIMKWKPSDDVIGPQDTTADQKKEAAIQKLRTGLANKNNVDAAKTDAESTYNRVFVDQSKAKTTAVENETAAYERAKEGLLKYIEVETAAAETVGKTAFEKEKAKATAQLLAAAIKDGTIANREDIDWTSKLGKEIEDLGNKAAAAAQKRKEATVDAAIKFDNQTRFLSPEDVSIARQLQDVFGSVGEALKSPQAEAIRFNNSIKELKADASSFALDFVHALQAGKSVMDSIGVAARGLAQKFLDAGITTLVNRGVEAAVGTATQTAGATTSATILTTAGATLAASMVAGATEAATILGLSIPSAANALPIAGALTGGEVATGGALGGAGLATGGAAAGAAIWGPIALLMAAVAAMGALSFFGGGDEKKKQEDARVQALNNRTVLAGLDTGSLVGHLVAYNLE